ncbi:GNAT family N-acetyltransferase [Paenisporosarcina quisquiliarum]|uniref:GNAT family N-acetyltransferase n=1 Tax=Paenisporosarcina quisquiliarum TaxID=365346 RepID=A0A9X3LFH5_9BACL|nr:GNAT family N-acetyltransferase [Paenisporosarcina quisquiliarum]MCZ8537083.1 GNAT family N-acetyltransferase [Paenisporosarcina quisquiliarum]
MSYHITRENNNEQKEYVNNQLFYYNLAHFPEDLRGRYEQISLFLKDENGLVRGGLLGEVCWNWLEIHTLMVDEDIREFGYGSKLLSEIEQIALEKKCDFIKVDTLSFQALDFYEKNGYQVFGSIDNVGREFKHYYLKKDLHY